MKSLLIIFFLTRKNWFRAYRVYLLHRAAYLILMLSLPKVSHRHMCWCLTKRHYTTVTAGVSASIWMEPQTKDTSETRPVNGSNGSGGWNFESIWGKDKVWGGTCFALQNLGVTANSRRWEPRRSCRVHILRTVLDEEVRDGNILREKKDDAAK
jgi:hypothetical protein